MVVGVYSLFWGMKPELNDFVFVILYTKSIDEPDSPSLSKEFRGHSRGYAPISDKLVLLPFGN